jgi:hypothetical protein
MRRGRADALCLDPEAKFGPQGDIAVFLKEILGSNASSSEGQAEAAMTAATRLTICGSRRALDGFTRWLTSLMI